MTATTISSRFDALRRERRDGQITIFVRETADEIESSAADVLTMYVHVTDLGTPYGPLSPKTVLKQYETVSEFFDPIVDLIIISSDGAAFLATYDDTDERGYYTPWHILVTLR